MARRKSHRRRSHRSGRRMSGAGSMMSVVQKVAGIAGGAVVANLAKKQFTTLSPKITSAIIIGAGVIVPRFARGNALISSVGDGMLAVGAIGLLQSFNVISGVPGMTRTPYGGDRRAVGTDGIIDQTVGSLSDAAVVGALFDN
jgi:hypothetical protein